MSIVTAAAATRDPKDYGLILDPVEPHNLVLGSSKELGGKQLVPSGDWLKWLPEAEYQNANNIEPYACVTFGTLNCVEILELHEYGITNNWSDRFLATISGTKEKKGNSPHVVAEALRRQGCVEEKELPFDSRVDTFDKFYGPIRRNLYQLAQTFFYQYKFGHEYVPGNAQAAMEALKYSPIGASVYAWVKDEHGVYYRPQGMIDNHFAVVYGYLENKYWFIFDTYPEDGKPFKKLRWDSLPMQMKRYTLHRQIVHERSWIRFLRKLRAILGI